LCFEQELRRGRGAALARGVYGGIRHIKRSTNALALYEHARGVNRNNLPFFAGNGRLFLLAGQRPAGPGGTAPPAGGPGSGKGGGGAPGAVGSSDLAPGVPGGEPPLFSIGVASACAPAGGGGTAAPFCSSVFEQPILAPPRSSRKAGNADQGRAALRVVFFILVFTPPATCGFGPPLSLPDYTLSFQLNCKRSSVIWDQCTSLECLQRGAASP